jgi:hypothetical protein
MPNSNREAGAPLPEKMQSQSEKEPKNLSHSSQALEKENQAWEKSDLARLLAKVKELSAKERDEFDFLISELTDPTIPLSGSSQEEKLRQIEIYEKGLQERFGLQKKLEQAKHLRLEYSFYLGSIGDWMEVYTKIVGVDFQYDPKKPLVKQLEELERFLPADTYKELETKAGKQWQEAQKIGTDYNEIIKELETTANVFLAEDLDEKGFFDNIGPQ